MGLLTVNPASEQKFVKETAANQDTLPRFTFHIPMLESLFQRSVTGDLSCFKNQIIASNVKGQLSNARIIYLLQPHKNNSFELNSNKELIKALFQPGDCVLIERDSSSKITAQQAKASIGLDPTEYNILGWDAPGPVAKAQKECQNWTWKEKEAFVISTWGVRQESLFARTKSCLSRFFNNRVFAVMGSDHGVNDDPAKSPRAIDFLPTTDYPWTIVAPRKQSSARP